MRIIQKIQSFFLKLLVFILLCGGQSVLAAEQNHRTGVLAEIEDISQIISQVDKHTLVILDLDYIIFRSKNSLGSLEWMNHFINRDVSQGISFAESLQQHYPTWMRAQNLNEMELMDRRFPDLLKDLRKKSYGIIAVTTRCPMSAELSIWQLNKFDIHFSEQALATFKYTPQFKHPTLYREGILFTHVLNKKTSVFAEWLYQYLETTKEDNIDKIVVIDAAKPTLLSMEKIALALNMDFAGFRYLPAERRKVKFKPQLADQEYQIITSNLSESEIHLMLEDLGSYSED